MDDKQTDEIVEKMIKGEVKPHKVAEGAGSESAATRVRRKYIEKKYSANLDKIGSGIIDFEDAAKRSIENAIGAIQIPVGYVELVINGGEKTPVFLATTEGKLVAGVNRGASAINKSGGTRTKVLKSSMTRSVIVETNGVNDSGKIVEFMNSQQGWKFTEEEFAKSTKHGKLNALEAISTGRLVYIRYGADTKAAMGMNMVTIASTATTLALLEKMSKEGINAWMISESGNMCTDKKPAMINVIKGRGISVIAEAVLKKEVLEEYFKVNAPAIREINYAKNYVGSGLAGAAHNGQMANILAATFLAYGQDAAQVVDAVNAFTDVKALDNGDLYISVYLPALEIGTYGGGTARETQKELLIASKVYGEGDEEGKTKSRLAELIASAVLAGELNLLSAEAGNELSASHAKVKRG